MDGDDNVDHDDHIADCCDLVLLTSDPCILVLVPVFNLAHFLAAKPSFHFAPNF